MKLFNLNVGIKLDNNQAVVDLITKDNYDVVTLQEAVRKLEATVSPKYDSSNVIRNATHYANTFFGAVWVAKRQIRNDQPRDFGGYIEQGNQLLTNLPIVKARNVFYYQEYCHREDTRDFVTNDHPRAFTDTIVQVGDQALQIINVHGCWTVDKKGNDRTKHQTATLLSNIRDDLPCIVVGDFNLLPDTVEIQTLSQKLHNLIEKFQIKTTRPDFDDGLDKGNMVCDYIFVNDKVKVNDFRVLNVNVSDHFPLLLDFEI